MYISRLAFVLAALSAASCIDKDVDNTEFYEKYARGFDNRTTVAVNIASEVAGEYYAVYFGNPYDGESLVKQPALTGFTPVSITLDVPKDVERLYVVAQGEMKSYEVGNLSISAAARPGPQTRAADVNPVSARVMTAVNSVYFPEKTNNVRGDDLFKCTDLVIDRTPSSGDFDEAEIWLTFLGDGGCRQSQLFGKLWFYTYPSSKQDGLTLGDCTFYGVKDGEVVIKAQKVILCTGGFAGNDEMVEKYYQGCDVVYGVRSARDTDTFFKKFTAEGFYKVMKMMGGDVVFNHADYRLMSRRALNGLQEFKEVNLFLRGVVPMIGYKSDSVYYERKERFAGESKYPLKKMLAFAWEGITSLSTKPIKMISILGGFIFIISIIMLIYSLIRHAMGATETGWTSTIVSIWAIGGLQLLAIGIIGEYIGKVYLETKERPKFIVEKYLSDEEK